MAGKSGRRLSLSEFKREYRSGGNKFSNDRGFIILRSGEGLTSFNKNTRAKFFRGKKVQ